jgi:1,4-dihydroxy-2-naphthoyl-CoA synthase
VPDTELDAVVADWCASLLAQSPQALRLTKMSIDVDGDLVLPVRAENGVTAADQRLHGWPT